MTDPAGAAGRAPGPGDPAPDLLLPDTHGTPVSLVGLRGGPVLLVFLPFAFSATCTRELGELGAATPALAAAGVRLLGVTCDPVFSLRAWREQEAPEVELLSDFWPHGAAARAYGVLDEEAGMPVRGSFLVGGDGVVRWSRVHPRGHARGPGEIAEALASL